MNVHLSSNIQIKMFPEETYENYRKNKSLFDDKPLARIQRTRESNERTAKRLEDQHVNKKAFKQEKRPQSGGVLMRKYEPILSSRRQSHKSKH
jgi:hypothetical protein